jgi:hypothetical protein
MLFRPRGACSRLVPDRTESLIAYAGKLPDEGRPRRVPRRTRVIPRPLTVKTQAAAAAAGVEPTVTTIVAPALAPPFSPVCRPSKFYRNLQGRIESHRVV